MMGSACSQLPRCAGEIYFSSTGSEIESLKGEGESCARPYNSPRLELSGKLQENLERAPE